MSIAPLRAVTRRPFYARALVPVAGILGVCLSLLGGPVWAEDPVPDDPLQSVMWLSVQDALFAGQTTVFDDRVMVETAPKAEDPMAVPLWIHLDPSLGPIQQVIVFADHNPIPRIVTYIPHQATPSLGLSFKVQEATPVRAAAQTADGLWHVGGVWVDAAGGGCTTPSAAQVSRAWETHLNDVSAGRWLGDDGGQRLRFSLVHPMDTGLVDAIPAFYLTDLKIHDSQGKLLAELHPGEPVAENPVFTLLFPPGVNLGTWSLSGVDSDGNRVKAKLPAGFRAAAAPTSPNVTPPTTEGKP